MTGKRCSQQDTNGASKASAIRKRASVHLSPRAVRARGEVSLPRAMAFTLYPHAAGFESSSESSNSDRPVTW